MFIIEKYKAITHPVEINVTKDKLFPIIGINECGKTTILQGIFAFDFSNDSFSSTVRHLSDVNNLYDAKSNEAKISSLIRISKKEIKDVLSDLEKEYRAIIGGSVSGDTRDVDLIAKAKNDIVKIRQAIKAKPDEFDIKIRRLLPQKKYEFVEEEFKVHPELMNDFAGEIIGNLPYILYFDDFKDSIDNKIEFPADRSKASAWFRIIERLFNKADPELDVYQLPEKEERQRRSILSKVKRILNTTIMKEWDTFRLDERDALEIDISYVNEEAKKYIKLDIVEKDSRGEEHYFYIKDRSKGFYWFFNFVMKLEFNPKVISAKAGQDAIYLLDEPGSYLHALAQQRLCKKLSSLSIDNIVIYCTHSHYLLNPSIIPLNSIKIAEKNKDGQIKLLSIFDYSGNITEQRTAFQPVWDALNVRPSLFEIGKEKVVIVEGIYDYYSLSLFKPDKWIVLPSVGADSVKYFISLLLAWNIEFRALWDNDEQGRLKYGDATMYFGDELSKKAFRLLPKESERQKKVILQNLYNGIDLKMIREELGMPSNLSFEKTILLFFYNENREMVLKRISERTRLNFEKVFASLE